MALSKVLGRSASAVAIALFILGCAHGLCQQSGQNANSAPASGSQPATPQAAKPDKSSGSKSSTAQQNPFPEAQSEAAAKDDSGNNSSSSGKDKAAPPSSSGAGYSSSDAQLPDDDLGEGAMGSHGKMDSFTRDHTLDGRIEDDLNIADLYMKNGNYHGALLRYQDAVQLDPQNDTALFGTANALCKQNHTAEAMTLLKSYAKNNPQGKYALKAEKLIAHPDKCAHNW